jgi:hypothetical protein
MSTSHEGKQFGNFDKFFCMQNCLFESFYKGVSCDMCMKSNFTGKRYKCLICYDFDLCSECHDHSIASLNKTDNKTSSNTAKPATTNTTITSSNTRHSHLNTHPMQCILTKSDYELYYGSSIVDLSNESSFTCPYCGNLGFSESSLSDHISLQHLNSKNNGGTSVHLHEVVCPICAVLPSSSGGDPNHLTEDLLQHINTEHLNTNSSNRNSNIDDLINATDNNR